MKQTILKYISLLAFLGSPFFSSQTFAAECATGTAPLAGCTIDVSDITYTLTGNITPASGDIGIQFNTDADRNTVTLTGNITTTGDTAIGLYLEAGDSNTTNLTGNITTAGDTARGLYLLNSDSNTTNLTGNITTTGDNARGLLLRDSDSNTTNLTGNITTTGDNSYGLYLDTSDSNTTNLTGNITTAGDVAFGLYLRDSDSNTTNLTGNITTTGDNAYGLRLSSSDSNTTNLTGNITTTGDGAYGLYFINSDSNTTNLTGNISTTGVSAVGLFLASSDSNTTNLTGNITTTGDNAYGLFLLLSDSNTTNLTGNISTTGDNANGLYLASSDSNTTTINGNIITSGTDGDSEPILLSNSDSNTFILSGAVHSLGGDQAIAVDADSQNNTFTFKRGVSFIGGLENNGGSTNKLIFDMGKASSYNIDTDGTTWTLEDTSKPIVSGSAKSMGVADIDNQAHILYRRMDPVNDVLSERQRLYTEGQRPTGYYMDSYYGHDKRDEYYSEISGNAGGVTVGYVLENTETPMEVLVNFEVSQDNYGSGLAKQTTETNSLLAGLYLPAIAEDVMGGNLSAKVLVGMSDNDAKRTVLNNSLGASTASEKVSGDYTSTYVSAGAEWLTEFLKVERVSHELSVGADLVQAYNEDYTAGEYKVDSRDMTQIQSRVLYGMTYKNLAKTVDVNTRFGVSNQYMVAGDKQDYQINGTSASYTGDDNSFYYTAGLGAKYYLADNTNLYVDTKYGQSSDDIQNLTVDFGFISRF
ncbi:hypothetical protein ABXT57_02095 [Methylophilaceae bacterium Uisw_097]